MTVTQRTFRAADARTALSQVKAALGPDAVIIGTREVGGGLFGKREIEVTAALAEAPRPAPALSAQQWLPAPVTAAPNDDLQRLRSTVEELQTQVRSLNRVGSREPELPFDARELMQRLAERGIEKAIAVDAVHEALDLQRRGAVPSLEAAVRRTLEERLVVSRAPWLKDRPRVIALVGPTGVGKTTTLAKIAARALMESRLKVSLITIDNYRIGASDQLARYGEIMKIPSQLARNVKELSAAIARSAGADLILIDSAGRSLPEASARQAELLRSVPGVQLHLVLSAAVGPRELGAAADRYRALAPERLILTKLDEAAGPGSLLSASVRIGRPIAAVTDGQRVPEDLHALTSAQLISVIFGSATPAALSKSGGH